MELIYLLWAYIVFYLDRNNKVSQRKLDKNREFQLLNKRDAFCKKMTS